MAYLWNRFLKKIPGSAIRNCQMERPSKIEAQTTAINVDMGYYSYCGYNCTLINCTIGRFCSIADNVHIGLASHPMEWVSTSPAFYKGRDSIPKNLASLSYCPDTPKTVIGHDVWIGQGVLIKSGITIGTGAVIAMGSVVTKDVLPYTIVGGNPAKIIRYRFSPELADRLLASKWWEKDLAFLKEYSKIMDNPNDFISTMEDNL